LFFVYREVFAVFRALTFGFALFVVGLFGLAASASAAVEARVHVATQRMELIVDGATRGTYVVSTGKEGHRTPLGNFQPQRMHKKYYSHKYHNAPMPHSIFFVGGVAMHATDDLRHLGKPASHGCVRLDPAVAAVVFDLVQSHGMQNSRIVVTE
jgi:lipoprotein-anchoring transpeptidase ErfK/SrfK